MLINRVGGGGENITTEVNTQTPLVQELAKMALLTGMPITKYAWLKLTSASGSVIGVLTSNDETEYPDGLGDDGFYYMRITHVLGIDESGDTFTIEI
jgi:hypothetical protein